MQSSNFSRRRPYSAARPLGNLPMKKSKPTPASSYNSHYPGGRPPTGKNILISGKTNALYGKPYATQYSQASERAVPYGIPTEKTIKPENKVEIGKLLANEYCPKYDPN